MAITTPTFGFAFLVMAMTHFSCASPQSIDCAALRISPIIDQVVIAGTRSYLPIAVIANHLDDVIFSIQGDSKIISIEGTQRGRATLTIDVAESDIGEEAITIEVTNGIQNACIDFDIKIIGTEQMDRIIHCDPNVTTQGDGSQEKPHGTLKELMASDFIPQAKDLILLYGGNHGNVVLSGSGYTLAAKNGHKVSLGSLEVKEANKLNISGLEIRPSNDYGNHNQYLVLIDSSCTKINFSNNQVLSTDNAASWTLDDWNKRASRGIKCQASVSIIQNNLVQNIFHGIKTEGNTIGVRYNHVDRFGGDAIRNIGSNNSYSSNFLSNATVDDYYDEGGNHDDLFQSWTYDKPIDKISLSDNIMISCIDTLMPQRAKIVQGLVCFDGFSTNWVVANNLVVTDHPHGIALYGAENCEIYENTVLRNPHKLYQFESDPWIMVNNHKDGRKSKSNVVRNNTCSALNIVSDDVALSENTVLDSTLTKKLVNYEQWDFRSKE